MKKNIIILFLLPVILMAQPQLKLMTFNIYHGENRKGKIDLNVLAEIINKENPDVVGLQEVDFNTGRSGKIDIALELAYKTGMIPLFARAMNYDGGEYGIAILTKYSIIKSEVFNLTKFKNYEQRVALRVDVKIGEDTLAFLTTHLDYHEDDTLRFLQIKDLINIVKQIKYPLFLLGDLNDVPESRAIRLLSQQFEMDKPALLSFPCPTPEKKIDYILKKTQEWVLKNEYIVESENASDHCAVVAEFEKTD